MQKANINKMEERKQKGQGKKTVSEGGLAHKSFLLVSIHHPRTCTDAANRSLGVMDEILTLSGTF